jgi:acetoin utilization deacetylase AcuC-like enzyme
VIACERKALAIVTASHLAKHYSGNRNPESPNRVSRLIPALRTLEQTGQPDVLWPRSVPVPASMLLLCHSRRHISRVAAEIQLGLGTVSSGLVPTCSQSMDVARLAVGCVFSGIESVVMGRTATAFCAVRPPGHHAGRTYCHGFCLFNNVALGARFAQRVLDIERVAILDWDAHHGNGTQEIFYDDPTVLYSSIHRHPWHLMTGTRRERGRGRGLGYTVNVPVPRSSAGRLILALMEQEVLPVVSSFKPDLLLMSAGFDGLRSDPLGGLGLVPSDYADITSLIYKFPWAGRRPHIVSVLEGGYGGRDFVTAAKAHVHTMRELGLQWPSDRPAP